MTGRDGEPDALADLPSTDLTAVLDAVGDVMYVFTADGEFRYWNASISHVSGYDDEEIAAMSPLDFFAGEDRERIADAVARVVEEDTRVTVEADLVTADGRRRPYEFSGVSIGETDDGASLIAGVGRDVSDRVETERELRRQNERLAEFTTVVSHDLRNPIDVANARLELAAAECDSEHVEVARESLRRMAAIVEDSLTLATQGQSVQDAEWLSLEAAARDAWQVVETGSITLSVEDDREIRADGDRLQHVFENLFRNAREHAGDGVVVSVGPTDGGFYVADDGVGIDPADRERAFEPGETDARDGTGFGLSIVRRIAEAHEWDVELTESPDGGACFEFDGVDARDS